MNIRGIGVDMSSVARWRQMCDRWGDQLQARLFIERECEEAGGRPESLASRWAAKEAVAKALGTGIKGFRFQDISVIRTSEGKPEIFLSGKAQELFENMGGGVLHLSLSHEENQAIAFVVWESNASS